MTELKEKFPKKLEDWFKAQYPQYDIKLGSSKEHSPGQPKPQDDHDLKKWKGEQRIIFENIFKEELESIENWQRVCSINPGFII